jgi:predicted phage replisome organizer
MTKRYYWLKLQENFFDDVWVKKLRKIAGGDTYTCIYLKMILKSLQDEGIITFRGIENTLAEEMALIIDEDPDNVQVTISFLMRAGLLIDIGNNQFSFLIVAENLGSESASAKRVRDFRERHKALQCNTDVTEMKREALQCNTDVTEMKQNCNGEIDIEKEKDIYIKDIKSDEPTLSLKEEQSSLEEEPKKKQRAPFQKPTVEEIDSYIRDKGYPVDAQEFYNYYEDNEWHCGKIPMKNWKNAVYAWNKNQKRWSDEKAQKAAEAKTKNSFQQNTYDYEQLEKDLVKN